MLRNLKELNTRTQLEVNTRITPIEAVMSHILQAGSVADIAIEDPPLEEVIAHIYSQAPPEQLSQGVETG